jgi:hypothetical protein
MGVKYNAVEDQQGVSKWQQNALQRNIKHQANIADLGTGKVLKHWYQIQKFVVVSIRKPAADRDRVLRVENVRRGRVVNDDGVLEIATDLGKVLHAVSVTSDRQLVLTAYLDVVALMIVTALSEKAVVHNTVNVEYIKQRITVLGFC